MGLLMPTGGQRICRYSLTFDAFVKADRGTVVYGNKKESLKYGEVIAQM